MTILRSFVGLFTSVSMLVAQDVRPAPVVDARVPKIYDCSKLLTEAMTTLEVPNLGAKAAEKAKPGLETALSRWALARLASAARFLIRPELRAGEELQVLGERWLVLLGRPEQHAWMDRLVLADLQGAIPVGRMKVQMVTLPEGVFDAEILPNLGADGAVRDVAVLEPGKETEAFVAAVLARDDGSKVEVGAVELRRMWPTTASIVEQTAYVKDYVVETVNGTMVADPIVDVVEDGLAVQAMATPLESGALALSITASLADLVQPIPTFTTSLGVGKPVTIQLPEVRVSKVEAAVEWKAGQIVAMALPAVAGRRSLVLVRVESLGEESVPERR